MSDSDQQTIEEEMPDTLSFLRDLGADDGQQPEETAPPPADLEVVPVNGVEYQVPKAVARAIEQGRRFQSDKDRLEQQYQKQEAELAAFKAQIEARLAQPPPQPQQPQGPSEFVRGWGAADAALGTEGVFENLGKMLESMLSKRDSTLSSEQQKVLDAFQAQQAQLAKVSQQTAAQELYGQAFQGVQSRMQQDNVPLSDEVQSQVVARFLEAQSAHQFADAEKERDFMAAWYWGVAESLRNKPAEPMMPFGGRPPVAAPIPAHRGGVPGQGFATKKLPRSDEFLSQY